MIPDPVIKICPSCRLSFSGGKDCPRCGEGHPLLDVGWRDTRRGYLTDRILARTLRTYYGARSAMLILFLAICVALVVSLALLQKAVLSAGAARALLLAASVCVGVGLPVVTLFAATRVVRRIARGCIGRPFDLEDVPFAPSTPGPLRGPFAQDERVISEERSSS